MTKKKPKKKVVELFAALYRGELVALQSDNKLSGVYVGIDGNMYYGHDLKIVRATTSYEI